MKKADPINTTSSLLILAYLTTCAAFSTQQHPSLTVVTVAQPRSSSVLKLSEGEGDDFEKKSEFQRRSFLSAILGTSTAFFISSAPAQAGIDVNALKNLPVEGDDSGVATRLRQIELEKNRPDDTVDIPYTELPNGVSYREFRDGKGTAVVGPGSIVAAEMTIRCKSFATAQEPGGVKYFDSRIDTDFNEVAFTVGSGEIFPGLEEAMAGMHRGSLRRIEIPSTMVFAAKKANQLPLPSEKNKDEVRRFENLFKTDATLLFEVLVTRVKEQQLQG